MTDPLKLADELEARIGQEFDGEASLSEDETRAIAQALRDQHAALIAAEIRGMERAAEWQPIDTAPKDGTRFLAYGSYIYPDDTSPTEYTEVAWFSGEAEWPWEDLEGLHPHGFYSLWLPIPPIRAAAKDMEL